MLTQGMRAKHASSTIARTNYHTHLPSFKRPAITFGRTSGWRRRRWNQSSEGRVGRVFKLGERSPLMCPPWATTPSAAINQAWQHAKRRWQHAFGDHEITPSSGIGTRRVGDELAVPLSTLSTSYLRPGVMFYHPRLRVLLRDLSPRCVHMYTRFHL